MIHNVNLLLNISAGNGVFSRAMVSVRLRPDALPLAIRHPTRLSNGRRARSKPEPSVPGLVRHDSMRPTDGDHPPDSAHDQVPGKPRESCFS